MRLSDTYLSLRHDVDVVAVEREGHVSEDGAAVLDNRDGFILNAAVRGPINTNLTKTEHKQVRYYYLYQRDSRNSKTKMRND